MVSLRVATCAAMFGVLAAAGLSGCNRNDGGSAATGQAQAADRHAARSGGNGGGYGDDGPRPPVPMFHGEPIWSHSRAHEDARENAEYFFHRNGASLGARTLDDFLTKVHNFGDHPPHGAQIINRSNGDKLIYDPKANLFGVFTRDGAPRTILKPSEGMAYWNEQKAREAEGGGDYHARSHASYGHSGGGYSGQGDN
jgi:hypothetical protein